VFEYIILPASALWGWVIWSEVLTLQAWIGMAMIAGAGALIALRSREPAPQAQPTV
jgi:drug/metabolite transporter (DMT)-like permease